MLQGATSRHEDNTHCYTMSWPRLRTTLPVIRLLKKLSTPHSLHQQHPRAHPFLFSRNLIPVTSIPPFPIQVGVEGLRTRSFTSTSSNSVRHSKSDDRHRRAFVIVNRPYVGTADDESARGNRKRGPFLPLRASGVVDAFVTTIVGVGISESCDRERIEGE